ncbi:MAG: hypothetical protein IK093_03440 [Ruminiclostridium sp.]|nr:hypothetical protein [Ruminiclostridium sp.]
MDENDVMVRERITALESSYAALLKRVDHIEELIESVQKMTVEIQHMREDLNCVAEKVENIESKPARNWDTLVSAVLGALAGGICTMIVTMLFGG